MRISHNLIFIPPLPDNLASSLPQRMRTDLRVVFADLKPSFGGSYEISVEAKLFDIGFKESAGFTCKKTSPQTFALILISPSRGRVF